MPRRLEMSCVGDSRGEDCVSMDGSGRQITSHLFIVLLAVWPFWCVFSTFQWILMVLLTGMLLVSTRQLLQQAERHTDINKEYLSKLLTMVNRSCGCIVFSGVTFDSRLNWMSCSLGSYTHTSFVIENLPEKSLCKFQTAWWNVRVWTDGQLLWTNNTLLNNYYIATWS